MSTADGRHFGKELAERPRAVAQEALQPLRHRDSALSNQELSLVSTAATRNGTVAAVVTAVVTGGAVAAANAFSPRFRSMFGVSGKFALIVTPSLGAFFLRSQQTINQALHDADGFIAPHLAASETVAAPIFQRELSPLQVAANMVYTHPFKTIMSIAGPIYGALFYRESTHPSTAHMPLSQRLIHTRVYGQMVAVLSTVAVMGFAKTMEGSGGIYRVEDAQLVRGAGTQGQLRPARTAALRSNAAADAYSWPRSRCTRTAQHDDARHNRPRALACRVHYVQRLHGARQEGRLIQSGEGGLSSQCSSPRDRMHTRQ